LEDFQREFNIAIHTDQPVIPVIIDSYGGEGYALKGMIATIEQSPVPVATICSTKAISCGAILFAFGTEGYRFLHPEAIIMIHDASWGTDGKVEDIKADAQILDHLNKAMFRRMAKHIGKTPDYILDLIKAHNHVDWYLTAKEAKRHNIANHLRIPTFEIEIAVNVRFA
jgi:ATP-dependent Clp protease protease subunit